MVDALARVGERIEKESVQTSSIMLITEMGSMPHQPKKALFLFDRRKAYQPIS